MNDKLYQGEYRIPSARLTDYDYGSNGMYFVTICTRNRELFLGDIPPDVDMIQPSAIGQVAIDCGYSIPTYFPFVELDAFRLMPNHLHGLLCISKPDEEQTDWQPNRFGPQRQNLGSIMRGYKSGVKMHATLNQIIFGWQPRYFDRVVRNRNELDRIRTYLETNPIKWIQEKDNLANLYM